MENLLKEKFLKVYANIPLNLREGIVIVFEDKDKIKKPLTWNAVFVEVKGGSESSKKILEDLAELKLI